MKVLYDGAWCRLVKRPMPRGDVRFDVTYGDSGRDHEPGTELELGVNALREAREHLVELQCIVTILETEQKTIAGEVVGGGGEDVSDGKEAVRYARGSTVRVGPVDPGERAR